MTACVVTSLMTWALGVRAGPSARLVYARAESAQSCPDEEAVHRAVVTRLGYDPFVLWAPTTLVVDVSRSGDRFVAVVRLLDVHGMEQGIRRLTTRRDQCADLVGALALTISIVIDPFSAASTRPPSDAPSSASSTLPPAGAANTADSSSAVGDAAVAPRASGEQAAPTSDVAQVPTPRPVDASAGAPLGRLDERPSSVSESLRGFIGVAAFGGLGFAPSPTAGAGAVLGARWRDLSLEIDGAATLAGARKTDSGTVRAWSVIAEAAACISFRVAFACGIAAAERIDAWADIPQSRSRAATDGLLGGRLGLEVPLPHGPALRGFGELLGRPARATIVDGPATYFFPPVAASAGLAAVFRFGS